MSSSRSRKWTSPIVVGQVRTDLRHRPRVLRERPRPGDRDTRRAPLRAWATARSSSCRAASGRRQPDRTDPSFWGIRGPFASFASAMLSRLPDGPRRQSSRTRCHERRAVAGPGRVTPSGAWETRYLDIDSIPTRRPGAADPCRPAAPRGMGPLPTSPRSSVPRPRNCVRRESIPANTPWIIATGSASVRRRTTPLRHRRPRGRTGGRGTHFPDLTATAAGGSAWARRGGVGWIAILVALFGAFPAGRFLGRPACRHLLGAGRRWRPTGGPHLPLLLVPQETVEPRSIWPQPRRSGWVLGVPSARETACHSPDGGGSGCRRRTPCGLGTGFVVSVSQPGRTRRRRGGHRCGPASRVLLRRRRALADRGGAGRRCGSDRAAGPAIRVGRHGVRPRAPRCPGTPREDGGGGARQQLREVQPVGSAHLRATLPCAGSRLPRLGEDDGLDASSLSRSSVALAAGRAEIARASPCGCVAP